MENASQVQTPQPGHWMFDCRCSSACLRGYWSNFIASHLVREAQYLIHMKIESLIDGANCMTEFKNTIWGRNQAALKKLLQSSLELSPFAIQHTTFSWEVSNQRIS